MRHISAIFIYTIKDIVLTNTKLFAILTMSKAINLLGVRGIADGKNWEYLSSYFLSGGNIFIPLFS